jgi:DNA-binding beta-propeller fold protein YncE
MVFEVDTLDSGSVWDLISTDASEKYILVADGTNNEVHVVERDTGKVLSSFGRTGRNAGEFFFLHNIVVDSIGNVYTTEVNTGKRVQKFVRQT